MSGDTVNSATIVRKEYRYTCAGLDLISSPDTVTAPYYTILTNVRSYVAGEITSRLGITAAAAIHANLVNETPIRSIRRLNDDIAGSSTYFIVSDDSLARGLTTIGQGGIDTGYSGNPVAFVPARPIGSPKPRMYVGDSAKMRKYEYGTDAATLSTTTSDIGLNAPTSPPTVVVGQPRTLIVDDFDSVGSWAISGLASGPTLFTRLSTTVTAILYDSGTTGWACVQPASMSNIGVGAHLNFNAGAEFAQVHEIKPGSAATDLPTATIVYESGTTGACSVQLSRPLAELDTDSLVQFSGSSEKVRVLSVTEDRNGTTSFRCVTVNNQSGSTVQALASFRVYLTTTVAATNTITSSGVSVVTNSTDPSTGRLYLVSAKNLSRYSGIDVSVDPENDDMHLSVRCSDPSKLTELQIYLSVTAGSAGDFTADSDFYVLAIKPSDFAPVIGGTSTVPDANTRGEQRGTIEPRPRPSKLPVNLPEVDDPGGGGGGGGDNDTGGEDDAVPRTRTPRRGRIRPVRITTPVRYLRPPREDSDDAPGTGGSKPLPTPAASPTVNSWTEIRVKMSDIKNGRFGFAPDRTLKDVTAIGFKILTTGAVTVSFDSWWIGGGYGPDVQDQLFPYLYRTRHKDTNTGVVSNWSPATRGGATPRRTRVTVTGANKSGATNQADVSEIQRWGGTIAGWRTIGTTTTVTGAFTDSRHDSEIIGDTSDIDVNYRLWPVQQTKASGTTGQVAGVLVKDAATNFNTAWAPGTLILINDTAYTIYRVHSTSLLEIYESAGAQSSVAWSIPTPVLLAQPLPMFWGPYNGHYFACGDNVNPGVLYWTNANDPDTTRENYQIEVTPPHEPLQNGCVYNGRCYVFSSDRMFEITQTDFGQFRVDEVPGSLGLFAPWAIAVGPAIFFLAKDGIYATEGGSARLLSGKIKPIFPSEGTLGADTNTVSAVNMVASDAKNLRLAYHQNHLYFNYRAVVGGARKSLVLQMNSPNSPDGMAWWYDIHTPQIACYYGDEGENIYGLLLGGTDSPTALLYKTNTTRSDTGGVIACQVRTGNYNQGDARGVKRFMESNLDADPNNTTLNLTIGLNNFVTTAADTMTGASRTQKLTDLTTGSGTEAKNIGFDVAWSSATAQPKLYVWETSYYPRPEDTLLRATDWQDDSYVGAKFMQGVKIKADTGGVARTVRVEYDGGTLGATLTVNHNGLFGKPYSFPTPFIAHTVRLIPTDANSWKLDKWVWVWEPEPELVTDYVTQQTSHELDGFQHLRDGYVTILSTATVTLTINVDGTDLTAISLATTGGVRAKRYFVIPRNKGKVFRYTLTSSAGFRLYQKDCEIRVKSWGNNGGYVIVKPFGHAHYDSGARI